MTSIWNWSVPGGFFPVPRAELWPPEAKTPINNDFFNHPFHNDFRYNCNMGNTYTKLFIHLVFAVKYRKAAITASLEECMHKYITGIVQNTNNKLIAINSAFDHTHLLIGIHPANSISNLMRVVKGESSEFINKKALTPYRFAWQSGFGAFSIGRSELKRTIAYIENQKAHHAKQSFRIEYEQLLHQFDIPYEKEYLFIPMID